MLYRVTLRTNWGLLLALVLFSISSIVWVEAYSDRVQCEEMKRSNLVDRVKNTIWSSLTLTDDKVSFVSQSEETDESRVIGRLKDRLISPSEYNKYNGYYVLDTENLKSFSLESFYEFGQGRQEILWSHGDDLYLLTSADLDELSGSQKTLTSQSELDRCFIREL